jgi:mRNA interferase MazF
MGKFAVGQVVASTFPFSDLSSQKLRPALVVAMGDFGDIILCQITSKAYSSSNPVQLAAADFAEGDLPVDSFIRPDKLFTADPSMIGKVYGMLEDAKLQQVLTALRKLFTR